MSQVKDRVSGIDAFRLLAAFCVISLHVGFYPMFDESISTLVRLAGRWAVPFFFLTTGYFLGGKPVGARVMPSLARAALIFGLACLILIPLDVYELGARGAVRYVFDEAFLHRGTHFHLWFLSAMVIALLVVQISDYYKLRAFLPTFSLVALALYLLLGAYNPISERGFLFAEELCGVPFIYLGTLLANRVLSTRLSIALIVLGLITQEVEAYALSQALGKSQLSFVFLFGTVPFTIGMFGLATRLKDSAFVRNAGRWGARYALGIYIIHPYFITFMQMLGARLHVNRTVAFGVLIVPTVYVLSLGLLRVVDRWVPLAIDLLAGDMGAVGRLDSLATKLIVPTDKSPPVG